MPRPGLAVGEGAARGEAGDQRGVGLPPVAGRLVGDEEVELLEAPEDVRHSVVDGGRRRGRPGRPF